MSGDGITPANAAIPFGRWQTGRNPRGATRDVCLSHSHLLPGEGGAGDMLPASSSRPASVARLHQRARRFRGRHA